MNYEFVRCAPDSRFPDSQCWYLQLPTDDQALFERVHGAMAKALYDRYGKDPHFDDTTPFGPIGLPKLGGLWAQGFELLASVQEIVYVNSMFGFLPGLPKDIMAHETRPKLEWPTEVKGYITISRWPRRPHWYLSTRDGRTFDPPKHNTLEFAKRHALKFVSVDRIRIKERCESAGYYIPRKV